MQIKMSNRRMLDRRNETAETLIALFSQMVRELDEKATGDGTELLWGGVQIETSAEWSDVELKITVRNYG